MPEPTVRTGTRTEKGDENRGLFHPTGQDFRWTGPIEWRENDGRAGPIGLGVRADRAEGLIGLEVGQGRRPTAVGRAAAKPRARAMIFQAHPPSFLTPGRALPRNRQSPGRAGLPIPRAGGRATPGRSGSSERCYS